MLPFGSIRRHFYSIHSFQAITKPLLSCLDAAAPFNDCEAFSLEGIKLLRLDVHSIFKWNIRHKYAQQAVRSRSAHECISHVKVRAPFLQLVSVHIRMYLHCGPFSHDQDILNKSDGIQSGSLATAPVSSAYEIGAEALNGSGVIAVTAAIRAAVSLVSFISFTCHSSDLQFLTACFHYTTISR